MGGGGYPIRQYRTKNWQIPKYLVENGRNTDTASFLRECMPGGHSLISPRRLCAAEQGMVFKVLNLKQGIQFHY